MNKILLVDGNNILHRAYHGLPPLKTAKGIYTNAVYGFMMMLQKILEQEEPTHVAICFDKGKQTFRHQKYQEYKAQRKPTDEELVGQFPLIRQVLTLNGYEILEMDAYEADDIIGTLAKRGQENNDNVIIFSGDKDLLQMLGENVSIISGKKTLTDLVVTNTDDFREKYGIEPKKLVDLKGLMGDPSDNIPGVAGVGEKTALKLLHQFGSLEEVYHHIDELPKNKMREKLERDKNNAFLSQELATIVDDVPLSVTLEDLVPKERQWQELRNLYKELEFRNLLKTLESIMPQIPKDNEDVMDSLFFMEDENVAVVEYKEITDKSAFYQMAKEESKLTLIWQKDGCCFGLKNGDVSYYSFDSKEDFDEIKTLCALKTTSILTHDSKSLKHILWEHGISLNGDFEDLELMAYLLEATMSNYAMDTLCSTYLDRDILHLNGKEKILSAAVLGFDLFVTLEEKLKSIDLINLYRNVELPLASVLFDMEITGIHVNRDNLKAMSIELEARLEEITKRIYACAGREFNINSPKQMSEILFDVMKLPHGKKTKTGYSTNNEVLEGLYDADPIIEEILLYRQLAKLKSTYTDGLEKLISPKDEKIHTVLRQTVTATGRLSSTEPNLQNIPIRLEEGRKIRKAFTALDENHLLLAADYSQIELRVLAHYAKDTTLIDSFVQGEDIHRRTAGEIFDVPMDQVDKHMRRKAKAVNFGIVYGISDYGLGRDLKIGRYEAKEYIEKYFLRYPNVEQFLKDMVAEAKKNGYVTTLMGRRRYLPDINHRNYNLRSFAERTAMNTPIQGTAADIIKIAMVRLYEEIKKRGLKSKMILQVHDELIFDCPKEERKEMALLVKDVMENAMTLLVPMVADLKVGEDWYSLKSYDVR